MELRPYQHAAIENTRRELLTHQSTLIVMPTASGKTVVFAKIAELYRQDGRILVLAHREELLRQAQEKIQQWTPLSCGIEQAEKSVSGMFLPDVTIASVQTLSRPNRLLKFTPETFALIIIDEAHHAVSSSYLSIMRYFSEAKLVGVSVGPSSIVELRKGCFGKGWVGPIEEAFSLLLAAGYHPEDRLGYETILLDKEEIESRGWTGTAFGWKRVRTILRHPCHKPTLSFTIAGNRLVLTDDHSIYRVEAKSSGTEKPLAAIHARFSRDMTPGDIVPLDDGFGWEEQESSSLVITDVLANAETQAKILVAVDTSSLTLAGWKAAGVDVKHRHRYKKRGKYGGVLPLAIYHRLQHSLPQPLLLYYEGAKATITPHVDLTKWAYMLGYWIGNGWIDQGGRVAFSVKNALVPDFSEHLQNLPYVEWKVSQEDRGTGATEIRACNVFVAEILRSIFGKVEAPSKFIPGEWIISWPEHIKRTLLQGLIDSDGHFSQQERNRDRYVYVTTSRRLADTLLSLLRSLGVIGSLYIRKPCLGGKIGERQIHGKHLAYQVHWSAAALEGHHEGHYGHRRKYDHQELSFHEGMVRKIDPIGRPQFVYDMEMDGHPSFVANGILVHNTATPDRLDKKGMGAIFETAAYVYEIRDAIEAGYLCPLKQKAVTVESLDLSKVRTTAGDLNEADLEAAMMEERPLHEVAQPTVELAEERPTLVFSPTVNHAYALAEVINRYKPGSAAAIDGTMDSLARQHAFTQFIEGETQFLCNVGIATEGVDIPPVACVAMARPTKSRALYAQCAGRGLRLHPSKQDCLILDYVGNSGKHALVSALDVLDGNTDLEVKARAQQLCNSRGDLTILEALDEAAHQLTEEKRVAILAKARFHTVEVDPFTVLGVHPRAGRWGGQEISVNQIATLEKAGIPWTGLDKGQASEVIGKIFNRREQGLCTVKMAKVLMKYGLNPDVTFEIASKQLNAIAQNGWKLTLAQQEQIARLAA